MRRPRYPRVMCGIWLTIAGASLEIVGLAFVFYELAVIRSHELGTAPPWAPLTARIRRLLKRPQVVQLGVAHETSRAGYVRAHQRPADPPDDATGAERLGRLERYVRPIDADLDDVRDGLSLPNVGAGGFAARCC